MAVIDKVSLLDNFWPKELGGYFGKAAKVKGVIRSGVPLACLCCWIELLRAFEIRYEIRCLRTFLMLIWCVYL